MRYFLIFAFSLPVMAADWGRYANGYVAPPTLTEIQVIRTTMPLYDARYVSPKIGVHPNKSFQPSNLWFAKTPPAIGVNTKSGK